MWHFGPAHSVAAFQRRSSGISSERNHRTIGGVTGDPRRPVGGDLFSDIRPKPIGADQKPPRQALAGGKPRRHRRAVLVIINHLAAHAQFDQVVLLASPEEHAVQIAAMHHAIGIAEPRAEGIAQIDMGDLFGRERIHQPQLIDIDGHAACGFADAEIVEGVEGVGSKLNAGADLAEGRGLFQQDRGNALLRETKCGGEAADAPARDQDG